MTPEMKFSRLYSFLVPRRFQYLPQYSLIFHLISANSTELLLQFSEFRTWQIRPLQIQIYSYFI